MAIYKHYVDNVSGGTANGGTGTASAHYSFSQAVAGISGGGYDNTTDFIFVYVKDTGVTYSEEGIDTTVLSGYAVKFMGTNGSFVEDGSKPMIANSSDYFMNGTPSRFYWTNFKFNVNYSGGLLNFTANTNNNFLNCDAEGNDVASFLTNTTNSQNNYGTHVNCTFRNFTDCIHNAGSNRGAPNFVYCYFNNADPYKHSGGVFTHWLINCVFKDSHVQDSHYGHKAVVNCLFYGSNGTNPQLYIGDRTTSIDDHLIVNNVFVDAPAYAMGTQSTKDTETIQFYNNFFHGNVSGNFDMDNNFDPDDYYGGVLPISNPIFVDESAGTTSGFAPLTASPTSNIGVWETAVGPLGKVFGTIDSGSLSLGTGDVGDIVDVSGNSFQLVQENPRVWKNV